MPCSRSERDGCLRHLTGVSRRSVCQRFQPLWPCLPRLPSSGTGVHEQAARYRQIPRPQQGRRDGAARHSSDHHSDQRPRLYDPLQLVPSHRNHGGPRPRLQFCSGGGCHGGCRPHHPACRLRVRMDRLDVSGEKSLRTGGLHFWAGPHFRLPASGRAVRELVAALQRASGHAASGTGHLHRLVDARL